MFFIQLTLDTIMTILKFSAAIPDVDHFKDSLIIITLDFSKPWFVMESLQRWSKEIKSHRDEWLRVQGIV